jgi:hypothetical protein
VGGGGIDRVRFVELVKEMIAGGYRKEVGVGGERRGGGVPTVWRGGITEAAGS